MEENSLTTFESPISDTAPRSALEWERMLPPSYRDILAQVQHAPPLNSSSKEIYDFLCNSVLLQNGTQGFWLDRGTGGICQSIEARGLRVVWGDNPSYWSWGRLREGSKFREVAYLERVWWLEVTGTLQCSLHPGRYTLSWRLSYQSPSLIDPLKFSLTVNGNEPDNTQCRLTASGPMVSQYGGPHVLAWRWDRFGWMEVDVGEFSIISKDLPVEVSFSMRETSNLLSPKSGLYLGGVVIRPSSISGVNHRDGFILGPCLPPPRYLANRRLGGLEISVVEDDDSDAPKSDQGSDDGISKPGIDRIDDSNAPRPIQGTDCGTSKLGATQLEEDEPYSQLEQARGEIDALKGTYARLENSMKAGRRTYNQLKEEHGITLAKVERVLKEKAALETEKARLLEQLAKAEADAPDVYMAVVEPQPLTTKVVESEKTNAQFEQAQASLESEEKLLKEIIECKANLSFQDRLYKDILSERNSRIEELVTKLALLKASQAPS